MICWIKFLPKEQQEGIEKRLKIIVSIQWGVWIKFHIPKNLKSTRVWQDKQNDNISS